MSGLIGGHLNGEDEKAMVVSTDNEFEGEFTARSTQPSDEGGFMPSPNDGVRLVHAFVCIRSPERRRAVLEYIIEQAKMDLR